MKFKSRMIALLTFSIGFNFATIFLSFLHVYEHHGSTELENETVADPFSNSLVQDQMGEHSQRAMRAIQNSATINEQIKTSKSVPLQKIINSMPGIVLKPDGDSKIFSITKTIIAKPTRPQKWEKPFNFRNVFSMVYRSLNIINKNSPIKVIQFDLNNLLNYTKTALPAVAHYLAPSGQHIENQTFLSQNDIIKASVSPAIAMAITFKDYDVAKTTIRDIHQKLLPRGFDFVIFNTGMTRRQLERLKMFCLCEIHTVEISRYPTHIAKHRHIIRPLLLWDILFRQKKDGVWWFEPGSRILMNDKQLKDTSTPVSSDPWMPFLMRGLKMGSNFLAASKVPLRQLKNNKTTPLPPYPKGVHSKCVTHPKTYLALNKQYHVHFVQTPPVDLSMFVLFRTELTMKGLLIPAVVCALTEHCVAPDASTPSCDTRYKQIEKSIKTQKTKNDWCKCQAHEVSVMSTVLHRLYHWNKDVVSKPGDYSFYHMVPNDLSARTYF